MPRVSKFTLNSYNTEGGIVAFKTYAFQTMGFHFKCLCCYAGYEVHFVELQDYYLLVGWKVLHTEPSYSSCDIRRSQTTANIQRQDENLPDNFLAE